MGRTPLGGVKGSLVRPGNPNFACPVLLCAIACVILKLAANAETPVSNPFRLSSHVWIIVPLVALGFVGWTDAVRVKHVQAATALVAEPLAPDASSPTGFAGGARELIVPEHNNDTYHWIPQTQQMLARGEWRVRQVDYDNAPFGRAVDAPSPYRWWLGLVAWCDHVVSGRALGASVERAALLADPILHVLLLVGVTVFVAWQFGSFSAAVCSAGLATIFPFAAGFIPGAPDDRALSLIGVVWSVLLLLAGLRAMSAGQNGSVQAGARGCGWFFVAGIAGGLGAWVSVVSEVPIIVGIALGGLMAAWAARPASVTPGELPAPDRRKGKATRSKTAAPVEVAVVGERALQLPDMTAAWWAWALGGAVTVLAACLIEDAPDHLASWQLRAIHPLYGVAWLGLGAVVVHGVAWAQRGKTFWNWRSGIGLLLALAAVAALPVAMWKLKNEGFLAADISATRLTKLPGGAAATNLWAWMLRDGITPKLWTTLLPGLLVLPAGWLMLRRRSSAVTRAAVAVALGPVLIALGFAVWHLTGWSRLDGLLLVLLVASTAATGGTKPSRFSRWTWSVVVAAVLALGVVQLVPPPETAENSLLSERELVGLIERDLARWLAKHAGPGGAVVLAPPSETTSLYYYGGLRGLTTLAWENQDGIGAAIRIVSASTPEEAKELIDRRGVTYLVIPSWDTYLDAYARIGMGQLEGTFINRLNFWKLPAWLRPVVYQLPTIAGFEGQSVKILEVVEDQDDSVALSRLAEYFVEMGQLDLAASVGQALRRFPADLGALVARAQVEIARNDPAAFARTIELLRPRLAANGDRGLLWDRRASLAVVLARAKQMDLARVQVQRCLADVDEPKLRSLSTGALYRLQFLGKAFGLGIADPRLHALALDLIPADLQSRL